MTVHVVGNINLDIILGPLASWPHPGTETILPDHTLRAGGAAANAALALSALGVPIELDADIGTDAFGDLLLRELTELGKAATGIKRVPGPTAYSIGITHASNERTFFTHLGHLAHYDPSSLNQTLSQSEEDLLLICGYFLMPTLRAGGLNQLLQTAQERNHTVILDTGWPTEGWTNAVRTEVSNLLPFIDILLPNANELAGWTQEDDLLAALAALEREGPRVIAKLGPEGAAWLEAGTLRRVRATAQRIVDTVGAGDAFNAGFIAAWHRGYALNECVHAGVQTAGFAISSHPRQYPEWSQLHLNRNGNPPNR